MQFLKIEQLLYWKYNNYGTNLGILVTKILGIKKSPDGGKQFVVVDAAMNDLIRPSFYQAYHHVLPVCKTDSSVTIAMNLIRTTID